MLNCAIDFQYNDLTQMSVQSIHKAQYTNTTTPGQIEKKKETVGTWLGG